MTIVANDNTTITTLGQTVCCSDGKNYILSGDVLFGPTGLVSRNCRSIDEAAAIVAGMHGGRKF